MKVKFHTVLLVMVAAALQPICIQAQTDAAALYKANCLMCHAADGSGNTSPGKALSAKDLRSAETQKQSDTQLTETISKGRNKMPAFGQKLKPDQIHGLIAYIRQLAKK